MTSQALAVVHVLIKRQIIGRWFKLLWLHCGRTMSIDVWLWRVHVNATWQTEQAAQV